MHAAVIAIIEAIKKGIAEETLETLKNPKAVLSSVDDSLAESYQKELWEAEQRKEEEVLHEIRSMRQMSFTVFLGDGKVAELSAERK